MIELARRVWLHRAPPLQIAAAKNAKMARPPHGDSDAEHQPEPAVAGPSKGKTTASSSDEDWAAVQEVQYSIKTLTDPLPKSQRQLETLLRRRSEVRVSFAPVDDDVTVGRIEDVDNIEGLDDPTAAYAAFTKQKHLLEDTRLQCEYSEMIREFGDIIDHYAKFYGNQGKGPACPFSLALKHEAPDFKFSGVMNYQNFAKLTREYPEAMWKEFKLRILAMIAYREQLEQMLSTAQHLDVNLVKLYRWADHLGGLLVKNQEEDEGGASVNDGIDEGTTAIIDQARINKIQEQDKIIREQKTRIEALQKQTEQYQNEIDASREDLAHINRKLRRFEQNAEATPIHFEAVASGLDDRRNRHATPGGRSTATQHTSTLSQRGHEARNAATMRQENQPRREVRHREDDGDRSDDEDDDDHADARRRPRRSEKAADAPHFYNDKDKDTVTFEVFYRQLTNKLEVNYDHYRNDAARRVYIESRLQGKASSDLQPYLRKGHPDQIQTTEQLLDHLWNEYYDPNARDRAAAQFASLKMKAGDTYKGFRNEFVRLAGECGIARSEYKREFHRRLIPNISRLLAAQYIDESMPFGRYAEVGAQIDLTYQLSKEVEKKETNTNSRTTGTRGGRAGTRGGRAGGAGARGGSTNTPTSSMPSREERQKLISEGKCFLCRQEGHIASQCPKAAEKRDTRIQAADGTKPSKNKKASNYEKLNRDRLSDDGGSDSDTDEDQGN